MMGSEEEEIQELEETLKKLEAMDNKDSGYGSPEPEKKDNMFKFFKEVLNLAQSWKVGNLKDEEIGKSEFSIRTDLELAAYFNAEGWNEVSDFFTLQANIVAEPTMGRKGFMSQLFVTQIKKEQKMKQPEAKRRGLFGGGRKDESE